jgi:hypothetical protein
MAGAAASSPAWTHDDGEMMMAVDFSKLGKTKIGSVPPPPVPPAGTYHGVIRSWKWAESRWKNKETGQTEAQLHFTIKPTEFGEDIGEDDRAGISLAEKIFTAEQGIQSDAQIYFMQEFLRSLGLNIEDRVLDEVLPEVIGAQVSFDLILRDGDKGPIPNVRKLRARVQ